MQVQNPFYQKGEVSSFKFQKINEELNNSPDVRDMRGNYSRDKLKLNLSISDIGGGEKPRNHQY